jgi:hypothetical protein
MSGRRSTALDYPGNSTGSFDSNFQSSKAERISDKGLRALSGSMIMIAVRPTTTPAAISRFVGVDGDVLATAVISIHDTPFN